MQYAVPLLLLCISIIEINTRYEKQVLGQKHPETLSTAMNLANALSRLSQHNYKEAAKIFRETLAVQKQVLGGSHPDTLRTAMNLGNVLANSGHMVESEALLRKTLTLQKQVLGDDHPQTCHCLRLLKVSGSKTNKV